MNIIHLLWIIPVGILCGILILRLIAWFACWKLLLTTNSNESGSPTTASGTINIYNSPGSDPREIMEKFNYEPIYYDGELPYGEVPQDVSIDDENTFGPTGYTPGGVSYSQVPQGVRMGHRLKGFRGLMRMKGSR